MIQYEPILVRVDHVRYVSPNAVATINTITSLLYLFLHVFTFLPERLYLGYLCIQNYIYP